MKNKKNKKTQWIPIRTMIKKKKKINKKKMMLYITIS